MIKGLLLTISIKCNIYSSVVLLYEIIQKKENINRKKNLCFINSNVYEFFCTTALDFKYTL